MKRFVLLGLSAAALLTAGELSGVRNVYVLKMSKGLDQYLANQLTKGRVFTVVTDPKLADAVLTDQIGEGFEAKLGELYPPPEPEEKAAEPEKKDEKAEKDKGKSTKEEPIAGPIAPFLGDTVNKLATPASTSTFGRAKGIVFLVDAKSKEVIWSSYDLPRDGTSKELDRVAADLVERIKRDLKKK